MTIAQMQARITALEEKLAHKPRRAPRSQEKARERARRRQFRLDAQARARRHVSGINRYSIQH